MSTDVLRGDEFRPTSVLDGIRLLHQIRTQRRANQWNTPGARSMRKLVIIGAIVVPGVIFLFLSFTLVMAISFGKTTSDDQANALLATLLTVAFATALAGSLSTALQSLFASDDVRFLVSLPIPVRAIFFDRYAEIARGAIPGALFGTATCIAFVLGRAEEFQFVAYGVVAVFLLSATAVTLGASTTAITVRFARPSQTRAILLSLSFGLIMGTALIWRTTNLNGNSVQEHPIVHSTLSLLPSGWARSALVRSVGSHPQTALPLVGLQLATLIGLSIIGARVFASTYTGSIERTEVASIRPTVKRSSPIGRRLLRLVPRTSVHWVKREWFLISRDFTRMSAALLPVGSVAVWVGLSVFWGTGAGTTRANQDQFWLSHLPVLILPWGISLGTTVFAIGAEGRGIDLVRSLPISASGLMRAKYFAYLVPILIISETVALISLLAKPGPTLDMWLLVVQTALLTGLFCAVDIAFASAAPRFDRDHAQRSTGFFARVAACSIGLMLAGFLIIGITHSPIGNPDLLVSLGQQSGDRSTAVAIVCLLIAAGVPILLLRNGRKRLARTLGHR